ncbi:branched-chain amino acid ABC transporter ATP-binding protein/permease [Phytohabitans kaempferiae]|uniref:ATP-binding cassette domain-containing protein n=1 Tax=Phytohabitans kaempferiae TaxID=1620943 RepID=A0ABV6LZ71_9ACTN
MSERIATARRLARHRPLLVPAVVFAVLLLLPLVVQESYALGRYQLILIYGLLALGMHFQLGFGGQFALGQGVAMGVAAYASGLLVLHAGIPTELSLLAAIAAAVVTNVLLSLPSLRLNGWYLALATIFLAAAFPDIVRIGPEWLGEDIGFGGIAPLSLLGRDLGPIGVYLLVVVLLALAWFLVRNLMRSGWGTLLGGLRESPPATLSTGVRLGPLQLLVYVVSAIPLGLAGGLTAQINQYVSAQSYGLSLTNLALASVLLGGTGTLWGPLVGTVILQGISFFIDPFSPLNGVFLGVALIVTRIALPQGIVGSAAEITARLRRRRDPEPTTLARAERPPDLPAILRERSEPTTPVPPLVVAGITKSFGGNSVLRGVDLRVEPGRLVALIGSNGSGKTTLINVVTGFVRPDGGSATVAGRDVTGQSTPHVAEAGLRRTFQVPRLIPQATVRENVELGVLATRRAGLAATVLRTPRHRRIEAERAADATDVCRWLGLPDEVIDRSAAELSLGLKRVVEIGRAVIARPALVCLDEPAAGLNEAEIERLAAALRQLVAAGIAVLLIEHNVRFVLAVSDDLHLLKDGRIAASVDLTADRTAPLPKDLADYLAWDDVSSTPAAPR